jgi:tripartite-type tricarboxylate transporter receptor subunit TctC
LISVPYKATQQAIGDVAAGRVDAFCDNMPSILPHAKVGRVRGIAVTSLKRSAAAPEFPTFDESGIPGFELLGWSGFSYQPRTPRNIVVRMSAEINKALATANVIDKFTSFGYTPGGGTPAEFSEFIRQEIDKWGKVIRTAGIKPQQ